MKNLFYLLIIAAAYTSCSVQSSVLKGHYLDTPYLITSDKPIDTVWSNIIDLFAQKGLSIKVIDKSSGLITTEKTSFLSAYTIEKADGTPENPEAWIVVNRKEYAGATLKPQTLTGEWNVRVKSLDNGKTSININITNITGTYYSAGGQYTPAMNLTYDGKSTGKFEAIIADYLK